MPKRVDVMLAQVVNALPTGKNYIYEHKWDGYRALLFLSNGAAHLMSRNQNDLTRLFPELAEAATKFKASSAILDGEVVAIDEHGRPSFQLLQKRTGIHRRGPRSMEHIPIAYFAFDLLYVDGQDLRDCPLIERRERLRQLFQSSRLKTNLLQFSDSVSGHAAGEALLAEVRRLGLEGVIAKEAASRYSGTRGNQWQKVKVKCTQDCIIGGIVLPIRRGDPFRSLVLGVLDRGELHYVAHQGGGLRPDKKKAIYAMLKPLFTDACPFAEKPPLPEPMRWVMPQLVCEVSFTEWTDDGRLRHPIFEGMRPDKDAAECVRESPSRHRRIAVACAPTKAALPIKQAMTGELRGDLCVDVNGRQLTLTNLDKLNWPQEGYTKGDLLRYYYQVAPYIIPHLRDRPLILHRFPNGVTAKAFYQHSIHDTPDWLPVWETRERSGPMRYAMCDSLASLLYLVNLGTIAQHPLHFRIGHEPTPDWILWDLDPEDVPFSIVCRVAVTLGKYLKKIGLVAYAKTSGGDGIHVMAPIQASYSYDQVQNFALLVANLVQAEHADVVTLARMRANRGSSYIYLDCLQNERTKSIASVYSPRAKPGATVSAPVSWAELARGIKREDFTIQTVPARVQRRGDLFAGVLAGNQRLEAPLRQLENLL